MRFGQTIALLSILSVGTNLAPVWGNDCIDRLSKIHDAQVDDEVNNDIDKQRNFTLCPNTTYTVNSTEYLSIFLPNTHVTCGEDGKLSNKCIIVGGSLQVYMTRSPVHWVRRLDDVVISGLTFTKSSAFTCRIRVPGDIRFENCHWFDNSVGQFYWLINLNDFFNSSQLDDDGLKLEFVDSIFENNSGGRGIISSPPQVDLSVKNCEFANNDCSDPFLDSIYPHFYTSLLEQHEGSLEVENSCFRNNKATRAMIFSDKSNTTFVNNFGENNVVIDDWQPKEQCGHILMKTQEDVFEGQAFDADVCPLGSIAPRNDDDSNSSKVLCYLGGKPKNCVETLSDITQAQVNDEANNDIDKQRNFTLCPNTTYIADPVESIRIFLPNTHVKCGEDGKLSNNCIIQGSWSQVFMEQREELPFMEQSPNNTLRRLDNVVISGLTFTKASGQTQCYIKVPGDIKFENCHWFDNSAGVGRWLIQVSKHGDLDDDMLKLEFVDSIFENNSGGRGILRNRWDTPLDLSVRNCKFSNNDFSNTTGEYTSLIKQYGGSLEVENCCFRDNKASRAMIVAESFFYTTFLTNVFPNTTFANNFGENNVVTEDWQPKEQCGDIQIDTQEDVIEGQAFDANICPLDSIAPRNNDDSSEVCYKGGKPTSPPTMTVAPTTDSPTTGSPTTSSPTTVPPTDPPTTVSPTAAPMEKQPSSGTVIGGCIVSLLICAFSLALLLT